MSSSVEWYALAKLVGMIFTRQLAARIPVSKSGVIINTLCPGHCKARLDRFASPAEREQNAENLAQGGREPEDGSRCILYAAFAGEESHGCCLDSCEIAEHKYPEWMKDEAEAKADEHIWKVVHDELEKIGHLLPGVKTQAARRLGGQQYKPIVIIFG
ncbi:hypothetical protein F4780DRAFT_775933 [Xylariomycetidae sp. FL0641]|nr:hypothetical protein F4780DRAFT_775933 [Xylariomycetidae sp. FL0641]